MSPARLRTLALALAALAVLAAGCSSSTVFEVAPSTTTVAPSASATSASAGAAGGTAATTPPGEVGPVSTVAPQGALAALAPLPPGSALPDDAACAARVTPAKEIRAVNAPFNATKGTNKNLKGTYLARVTGDFTGTTDEILQWAACKWGIPSDVVRAQAAKESYWRMTAQGDWTDTGDSCPPDHPLGVDGKKGECPESYGLLQVRWNYSGPPAGLDTWPEVVTSTAYHVDYTYAIWRSCYEGAETWLDTTERGATYAPGDLWGCVGVWFSGRWYTPPAKEYIAAVQDYVRTKIWTKGDFVSFKD